jgi:cytochrome P450
VRVYDFWMEGLTGSDPGSHPRLRGLVNRAFSPVMAEQLRPFSRTTAGRLAEAITPAGRRPDLLTGSSPRFAAGHCQ